MRDNAPWTIPLGRWGEIPVRLHIFFVLTAAGTLYVAWLAGQWELTEGGLWLGLLGVCLYSASVGLHAAGHVYAATQLGTAAEPLVVGPLGDLAECGSSRNPRSQLIVALAGPAVNLLVALACMPGVIAAGEGQLAGLLNPFAPVGLAGSATWMVALKLALWINWMLAVVNLLPARPLDGGPAALCIAQLIYPRASRRRIAMFVARVGWFTGAGLILAAVLLRDWEAAQWLPPWFTLLVLGVLVLFSAQRASRRPPALGPPEDDLFGYDFSQGYTSLERGNARVDELEDEGGPLERWLDTRREARRERQEQLEAEEDERVDEILARVHQHGLEGLTDEERVLLQRVSMRYRSRLDQSQSP